MYSDVNWISDTKDSKSTSGYIFTMGRAAVLWKLSKKTCITRTIIELKFIVLDKAEKEVMWLWNLLEDTPFGQHQCQ
jgi:hypothetical protein